MGFAFDRMIPRRYLDVSSRSVTLGLFLCHLTHSLEKEAETLRRAAIFALTVFTAAYPLRLPTDTVLRPLNR